jgi:hypothetical protein
VAKKKVPIPKPICGTCGKSFDGVEAAKAAREGRAFIHACGRVLVREKGSGNAEVPTLDLDDGVDDSDLIDTSTSE